ncbi:MAG TPA: sulfatase-like hydrolase/transferase [Edaphocola sp.]|nr:sulfatase-like hydrolase/transferase [Edaphocola sp.]
MNKVWKPILILIMYFLFWLSWSWMDRLFFIVFARPDNVVLTFPDFIDLYYHGFRMDLSMAAYLCFFPFIIYIVWSVIRGWKLNKIFLQIYTFMMLFIMAVLTAVNINLYPQWTDKVNKRAIDSFFEAPREVMGSADSKAYFIALFSFLFFFIFGIILYRVFFKSGFKRLKVNIFTHFLILLSGSFILFSFIRGGYGKSTLNESMAYYSSVQFKNHAAINTYWAFISDYVNSKSEGNPYLFYDNDNELNDILKPVFSENEQDAFQIQNNNRPNIVLIIMESFVGDLVGSIGGEKGITPNLDSLSNYSYSFSNCYSVAERSDKGMIGIFSGFPAQGKESIIKHVSKHEKLPAFSQELKASNYATSFYYGGQSEFYNFKSFMLTHGIDKVIDQSDFPAQDRVSSWGVYDEKVFEKIFLDLNQEKKPFFNAVFTITNHEPFDLPGNYKFGKNSPEQKFKSTAYYTDSVIGAFIKAAEKSNWYQNTLFVITADHGHPLPLKREITDPQRFHIPLIFFGPVIKDSYKGIMDDRVMSQSDIAISLLGQLNIETENYPWSRNVFNTSLPQYAFFNTSNSWGVINKQRSFVTDFNQKENLNQKDSLLILLKAYNQKVFQQFLKY